MSAISTSIVSVNNNNNRLKNNSYNNYNNNNSKEVIIYEPDIDELDGDLEVLLWRIFTFYTINGNPQTPMFLRAQTFTEFCEEANIIDEKRVLKQDCTVIYKDIVSKRADDVTGRGTRKASGYAHGKATLSECARQLQTRHDPEKRFSSIKKMNFSDFLNALSRLGKKIYPGSDEHCLERLLDEKVFRYSRRRPVRKNLVELKYVREMYEVFSPSFQLILQYYGEFRPSIEREDYHGGRGRRFSMDNNLNSMANALGFEKWLQFCEDFNLRSSMNNTPILTSIELSEIFLSSVKAHIVDHIGRLTFDEFWEAIIRCALVAYREYNVHVVLKVKELFVYMCHKIDKSLALSINAKTNRNVTTNSQNGLSGMKDFQFRVTNMWRNDGVPRTYLVQDVPKPKSGRALLKGLKQKRQQKIRLMNEVEYTLNNADNNSTRRSGGVGGGKTDADEYYGNRTPGSPRKSNVLYSMLQSPKKVHDPTLPMPWRAAMDPRGGGIYYYNKVTKQTSWERPLIISPKVVKTRKAKEKEEEEDTNDDKERGEEDGIEKAEETI